MRLAQVLAQNRSKTAINRTDFSRPIKTAITDRLIGPQVTVFDFGCGLGDDVRYLNLQGIKSWGWDPEYRPDGKRGHAEIVNLGFVANVIEDVEERGECLRDAWSYADKALIVSARLASQAANFVAVSEYRDGFVTSIPTFQKLYEQNGLKDWIEGELSEPAIAAGPGTFYIFRNGADRIGFLASRYRRSTKMVLPTAQSTIEEHKDLLQPLVEFFEVRGRAPGDDELPCSDQIRDRFGSLQRALRLLQGGYDPEEWKRVLIARGQDLLLFLALARFDGRPRFGQLPMTVRRDIKSLFSSYTRACEEADTALLAVGDMRRIQRAANRSEVGKCTQSAIYVHKSALDALPPLLRLYEGCARRYVGRVDQANIVKLHTDEPIVSYLSYPDFEIDPHPALARSLTVHLQTFKLRERDYNTSRNPPILHRKENFIASDHPLHAKFSRLTQQEEKKGLFEDTARIGTRDGWAYALANKRLRLRGHRVIRDQSE